MKCEFCGGEVGRTQRFCSYCGGENQTAVLHAQKLEKKREKNQDLRESMEKKHGFVMFNKVMTFVLIGSIVLFITSLIVFAIMDGDGIKRMDKDKAEKLYAAGEYGKLQSYVENCEYDYSNNKYTQLSRIYRTYMRFIYDRNEYIKGMETNTGDLESSMSLLASNMIEIMNPLDSWGYEQAFGKNQEIFEDCQEDVKEFLMSYFEFTEKEVEAFVAKEGESAYELQDELVERLKRVYYKQKGEQQDE